jgi:adenosylcobinamide kinase/adenosylcobinamide-phosphate guanylyltransferase
MLKLPPVSLVTGGAASGKSQYSERLAIASGRPRIYLATAQIWDEEMRDKAVAHRAARGPEWTTIETGADLAPALVTCGAESVVLIDCLTMWLTAVMMAEKNIDAEVDALLDALRTCPAPVIAVTNEVGQGIVPDTPLGRRFRNVQGRLNQRVAAAAGSVIAVMSGLPLPLKGPLPETGP